MSDYADIDGNPRSLYWMIRNEPEWAQSRHISMQARITLLEKVAEAIEGEYARYGYNCMAPEINDAMQAAGYLEVGK